MNMNINGTDFAGDEYDFGVGTVKGLRSWDIDEHGRLHGITHREVWTPGVNVSTCKRALEAPCPGFEKQRAELEARQRATVAEAKAAEIQRRVTGTPSERRWWRRRKPAAKPTGSRAIYAGIDLSPPSKPQLVYYAPVQPAFIVCNDADLDPGVRCIFGKHYTATDHHFDPDCNCGFWAYDEAGFTEHGPIVGLIEAHGKLTIGPKGFRAEKARIIAIARDNGTDRELTMSEEMRLKQLYPDVTFYDDIRDLAEEHLEVLHTWPEPDAEFWTRPVPDVPGDDYFMTVFARFANGLRP